MFLIKKKKKKAPFLHRGHPSGAKNSLSGAFNPTEQSASHRECNWLAWERWWGLPGWQALVCKVSRNLACSAVWHRPEKLPQQFLHQTQSYSISYMKEFIARGKVGC